MVNMEENSEKIGKIQKKMGNRYGKYGRNCEELTFLPYFPYLITIQLPSFSLFSISFHYFLP
jgi:hypothetical protein